MSEKPILFSGPMVRAILDGQKTVTRRVAKLTDCGKLILERQRHYRVCAILQDSGPVWRPSAGAPEEPLPASALEKACPYGRPGDRLWVRDTWRAMPLGGDRGGPYFAKPGSGVAVDYKATHPKDGCNFDEPDWCSLRSPHENWRPSIHMPRWACRLTLDVVSVRVERLQDITEEDAKSEGVEEGSYPDYGTHPPTECFSYVESFGTLWDTINGKRPGCSWADNPWVWRVEFKVKAQS